MCLIYGHFEVRDSGCVLGRHCDCTRERQRGKEEGGWMRGGRGTHRGEGGGGE